MSLGKGTILGISTRQELNTHISTEVESVAAYDCMLSSCGLGIP